MSQELNNLLSSSHKRLVASIMRHVEKDVYPHLSLDARRDLREVVVRAAGAYHDTALDCLKATSPDDSVVTNEHMLELVEQMHRVVVIPRARDGRH